MNNAGNREEGIKKQSRHQSSVPHPFHSLMVKWGEPES